MNGRHTSGTPAPTTPRWAMCTMFTAEMGDIVNESQRHERLVGGRRNLCDDPYERAILMLPWFAVEMTLWKIMLEMTNSSGPTQWLLDFTMDLPFSDDGTCKGKFLQTLAVVPHKHHV
jgi:hypothetical protein